MDGRHTSGHKFCLILATLISDLLQVHKPPLLWREPCLLLPVLKLPPQLLHVPVGLILAHIILDSSHPGCILKRILQQTHVTVKTMEASCNPFSKCRCVVQMTELASCMDFAFLRQENRATSGAYKCRCFNEAAFVKLSYSRSGQSFEPQTHET